MTEQTEIKKICLKSLLTLDQIELIGKNKVIMVENQLGQYQGFFQIDAMIDPSFKLSNQSNNLNIIPVVTGG